jgi:hypothetical protein
LRGVVVLDARWRPPSSTDADGSGAIVSAHPGPVGHCQWWARPSSRTHHGHQGRIRRSPPLTPPPSWATAPGTQRGRRGRSRRSGGALRCTDSQEPFAGGGMQAVTGRWGSQNDFPRTSLNCFGLSTRAFFSSRGKGGVGRVGHRLGKAAARRSGTAESSPLPPVRGDPQQAPSQSGDLAASRYVRDRSLAPVPRLPAPVSWPA